MNHEITNISNLKRLTSTPRGSVEKTTTEPAIQVNSTHEAKQFEIEMQQINHAFTLVHEIRQQLETALKNLSPSD